MLTILLIISLNIIILNYILKKKLPLTLSLTFIINTLIRSSRIITLLFIYIKNIKTFIFKKKLLKSLLFYI